VAYSFLPSLPFVRDTQGDLASDQSEFEGDVGGVIRLDEDTDLELRYTRSREQESGDLLETVIQDEQMGDPPSVTQSPSSLDIDSRQDLLELGFSTEPGDSVVLDLGLEWAREDLATQEIVEGVTTRFFDGTLDEFGAEGAVSVDLGRSFGASLSGGHVRRPTESSAPGVQYLFADDRSDYAELEGRWRPSGHATLSARTRYEHLESDAFDSNGEVVRHGLSLSSASGQDWSWNGSFVYRTFDREAKTNALFFDPSTGTTLVPALATFEGIERTISASTAYEVTSAFAPRASATASLANGDSSFDYYTGSIALPWKFSKDLEVGIEVLYLDFEGEGLLAGADYDALVLELYVRKGFEGRFPR